MQFCVLLERKLPTGTNVSKLRQWHVWTTHNGSYDSACILMYDTHDDNSCHVAGSSQCGRPATTPCRPMPSSNPFCLNVNPRLTQYSFRNSHPWQVGCKVNDKLPHFGVVTIASDRRWRWRTPKVPCVVPERCFIRNGLWWQLTVSSMAFLVWRWNWVPVMEVALWGPASSGILWCIPTLPEPHTVQNYILSVTKGSCCRNYIHYNFLLQIMTSLCCVWKSLWNLTWQSELYAFLDQWTSQMPMPPSLNGVQLQKTAMRAMRLMKSWSHRYWIKTLLFLA